MTLPGSSFEQKRQKISNQIFEFFFHKKKTERRMQKIRNENNQKNEKSKILVRKRKIRNPETLIEPWENKELS